jgi:predicted ArsR family transcriptional regulator
MVRDDPGLAAVIGLGDPVRRRLYEFVSECAEPVRRDEAAAATGIGCQLAAYHLDKLVGLGLLTASYQRGSGQRDSGQRGSGQPGSGRQGSGRQGSGAGRPAKVYTRSSSEFAVTVPPREYELAAHLLASAVESDTDGTIRPALLAAAERFGRDLARRGAAGEASPAQDAQCTLREHGYEPWQDGEGTIRLHNCPFHQLAAGHPELVCGMNLALITGLVEGLGADPLHPVLDPKPGFCCVAIGTGQSADLPRRP